MPLSRFVSIIAITALIASIGAGIVAGKAINRANSTANKAGSLAAKACERSRYFGPLNYKEHQKMGVYSVKDLAGFYATIPTAEQCKAAPDLIK